MHVENIQTGECVTATRRDDDHDLQFFYQGVPMEVLAVSPPFLFVQDLQSHQRGTLDTRRFHLTRCTDDYVEAYRESYPEPDDPPEPPPAPITCDEYRCTGPYVVRRYDREARIECTRCGTPIIFQLPEGGEGSAAPG